MEGTDSQNGSAPEIKSVRYVVAALILRGDQVLICQRRPDQPMALQWEFPGGKIEPGEGPEAALARELNEELGITATIGPRVTHIRHPTNVTPNGNQRRSGSTNKNETSYAAASLPRKQSLVVLLFLIHKSHHPMNRLRPKVPRCRTRHHHRHI